MANRTCFALRLALATTEKLYYLPFWAHSLKRLKVLVQCRSLLPLRTIFILFCHSHTRTQCRNTSVGEISGLETVSSVYVATFPLCFLASPGEERGYKRMRQVNVGKMCKDRPNGRGET